ncbi:MAG: hypothetical protein J0L73_02805 [Verrucomicrobia bacterium]|nr:hypothetical protein [Verrucomicrobiota bacterium]
MPTPKDVIWNTITDSAKTRFDYDEYKSSFSELGNENAVENILFMIIVGYAEEQSVDEIVSKISKQLLLIGFGGDVTKLNVLVVGLQKSLPFEIKATQQALAFFDMGLKPPGILVQVKSILGNK